MLLRTTGDLAALVRERRKELGLTQAELGRLANLRRATIADLEAGKSGPVFDTVLAILQALGVGLDVWVGANATFGPQEPPVDLDDLLADVRRSP